MRTAVIDVLNETCFTTRKRSAWSVCVVWEICRGKLDLKPNSHLDALAPPFSLPRASLTPNIRVVASRWVV